MKKKVLLGFVLLVFVGVSAVFSQSINGVWKTATGNVISFYDNKGVWSEMNVDRWQEAERRGIISIGTTAFRNIRSTGNLTWTGENMQISDRYAISWINFTITVNPNGQTLQVLYQGDSQPNTWTRVSGYEYYGVWVTATGNVISFFDNKGVWTEMNVDRWQEAERRGIIGIGTTAFRNIRSTGNLTWTGQNMQINDRWR
jgi:hypothetical protein